MCTPLIATAHACISRYKTTLHPSTDEWLNGPRKYGMYVDQQAIDRSIDTHI